MGLLVVSRGVVVVSAHRSNCRVSTTAGTRVTLLDDTCIRDSHSSTIRNNWDKTLAVHRTPPWCVNRRQLLGTIGAAVGVSGCLSSDTTPTDRQPTPSNRPTASRSPTDSPTATDEPSETDEQTPTPKGNTLDGPVGETWPQIAYDAANTGWARDGTGLAAAPTAVWQTVGTHTPPVVADGRVVTTGFSGQVRAVRSTDGVVVWERSIAEYPNPVAVGDGAVYTLSAVAGASTRLRAFELADGTQRWAYGRFEEAFGGPTVADGVVYAPADEAIHAVRNGQRLWRTAFPEAGAIHGEPALADGRLFVVSNADGREVAALDAATGERLWTVSPTLGGRSLGGRAIRYVTAGDGLVYVGRERRYTDPFDTPTLVAFDAATGERVGGLATVGRRPPRVALAPDGLVVLDSPDSPPDQPGTDDTPQTDEITPTGTPPETNDTEPRPSRLYGASRDLSARRWTVELPGDRTGYSTPAVVDSVAYVTVRGGSLHAVDTATGRVRWQTESLDRYLAPTGPAVTDGVVFLGGSRGLYAFAR